MNRRLVGRIAAVVAIGLVGAGGLGPSWRSLGLEYGTIQLGLYRVTLCGDCEQTCTGMRDHCETDAKAQYGECNRADCHVEHDKTVCTSNACRQVGHCATQLHRCKTKCANTPACESTSPFQAGRTLQLGPRDRHLMALAGVGGLATLLAGALTVLLLAIAAARPRPALATAGVIVAAIATVAGVGFELLSGMKSPVGGTSVGWSAIAWIVGGGVAIVAAVLLRARSPSS
jgi:hypothetical protein